MENKAILTILLFIFFVSITGCTGNKEEYLLSEIPTQETTLAPILETASPSSAPMATASEITIDTTQYDYINNLNITKDFTTAKLFVDEWATSFPFSCGETKYEHSIGMWIPSKYLKDGEGDDTISYALNGTYSKIKFDLFTDSNGAYGNVDKYGSYQIKIYADNKLIYDSKTMYCDTIIKDIEIELPANSNELTIELLQTKGEYGTLDTVIGNFRLYYTDEYISNLSANPTIAPTNEPFLPIIDDFVWINVEALYLRAKPDFGEKVVEKLPYGYCVSGSTKDYWMYISWEGVNGWIYIGKLDTGRPCVVYSHDNLESLD